MTHINKHLRIIQLALLTVGLLLSAIFVAAYIHRVILSHAAVSRFQEIKKEPPEQKPARSMAERKFSSDFSRWSPQRVVDYEKSLREKLDPPLAVLRITKVHLEVPVLDGIDDLTLNRGVGYIPGTSRPGEHGNVGIAGHRDGFFRVLKNVSPGDMLELETLDEVEIYRVDQIVIVDKDDASVLRPTAAPTLTLVTCYPFYFIGSAPRRYIVMASLVTSGVPEGGSQHQRTSSVVWEPALLNSDSQSQKPTKEITR